MLHTSVLRSGRTTPSEHSEPYKPKTVKTRAGEITFSVPQVRGGDFYPGALEKGLRSERALTLALAEMYVQGVSTRKVAAITEKLCGTAVSSAAVSRAASQLDEVVRKLYEGKSATAPLVSVPTLSLMLAMRKSGRTGR